MTTSSSQKRPLRRLALAALFLVTMPFVTLGQDTATAPKGGASATKAPKKLGSYAIEVELPRREVRNQGMTGTCWAFATTSFVETEIQRLTGKEVNLSEIYFARAAIVEKARRYVLLQGKAQFDEGGLSHDVMAMIRQHGAMPLSEYSGLQPGKKQHDHSEMFKLLKAVLVPLADEKAHPSDRWESAIAGIVDAYLGTPPAKFTVDGKEMDAKEYAKNVLNLKGEDYVEVMSDAHFPFHENAELIVPDNWMHFGGYLNLPLDEFVGVIDHALDMGYSISLDADVSEPGADFGGGTFKLPAKLEKEGPVTQEVRDRMFQARETTDDHMMHIVGRARGEDGAVYYLTKNSHGQKSSQFGGNLFISANYLRAKALAVMVHKDVLQKKA